MCYAKISFRRGGGARARARAVVSLYEFHFDPHMCVHVAVLEMQTFIHIFTQNS